MGTYLMVAGTLCLVASVVLFDIWLKKRQMQRDIRVLVSMLFLLAGPMIYQTCHQVMFINYMPFLCLALIGVDCYFDQHKAGLYIIGTFLMIMTSFYFSLGGILALVVYGISRYVGLHKRSEVSVF